MSATAGTTRTLRIGTRGSPLALVQARWTADTLAESGTASELVIIRTEGDDRPPNTAWGEGAFVARIAAALAEGEIDVAVHSAKDLPTDENPRLVVAAFPPREDPRDALVARVRGTTLATLPQGARVGTDSPRRTAFLRAVRPDLQLHPLDGNVDTRLAKLDAGQSDALVLAVAGLTRLGRADRIDEILPTGVALPAPGQGSLAIQVRADDAEAIAAIGALDDPGTRAAVEAERAFLAATGGGCRAPIGALGTVDGTTLTLQVRAARTLPPPCAPVVSLAATGSVSDRMALAEALAMRIVERRARPRVLITRPDAAAGPFVAAVAAHDMTAVVVPAIATQSLEPTRLAATIGELPARAWIVVTSPSGAAAVADAALGIGLDPATHRWAAVGSATGAALERQGIAVTWMPREATAARLAAELPLERTDTVLVARSNLAGPRLAHALRERGARVVDVEAYTTIEAPPESRARLVHALEDGPLDAVVYTSGSTIRGLFLLARSIGPEAAARIAAVPAVCIGASTLAVARELGARHVAVADQPSPAGAAEAVARLLDGGSPERVAPGAEPADPAGPAATPAESPTASAGAVP
jgi:hydroxymethylbilane synthase